MPAIKIASKNKITLDVEDENGKVRGQISFDPKDLKAYNAFTEIGAAVTKIYDDYQSAKSDIDISEGKLESLDEYKSTRDKINRLNKFTNSIVEQVGKIAGQIDSVFGNGTSELVLQGSYDVELLAEFIQVVMPYFEKAKEKRLEKYIDDADKNGDEVM